MDTTGSTAAPPPHGIDVAGLGGVFRTLFDAYPDALVVADANGRIVLANPSAGTPARLLGRGARRAWASTSSCPTASGSRHAEYRRGFAREPRARPMGKQTDLVAKRKDGTEVVVEIALSPLHDQGHPLVVAAIRDIGAYPRMKQALLRAHYSEVLARVGRLAVDTRDPQVLLDRVPAAASEALQVEVAMVYLLEPSLLELRIAGRRRLDAGRGDRPARRQPSGHFARLRSRPGPADRRLPTIGAKRASASPPHYLKAGLTSAVGVPLSDRGRTIGVLVVRSRVARSFGDDEVRFLESLANLLTSGLQRAQSEEALNHAQRLESVGQLTGGIAHDFNNLLTVIQGNLQVLAELPADADELQRRPLVDAAFRASRRGAELTGKLLAFSRRQVLQPLDVDAAAMLHSLADMLRRTLDQRIRIEVEIPPGGVGGACRPGAARVGPAQHRDQRARCDAGRRHASLPRRALRPPAGDGRCRGGRGRGRRRLRGDRRSTTTAPA